MRVLSSPAQALEPALPPSPLAGHEAPSGHAHAAGASQAPERPRGIPGVSLFDPDLYLEGPPHQLFKRLRQEAPISWQEFAPGAGYWAITRYADCVAVSKAPEIFSSNYGTHIQDWPAEDLTMLQMMLLNMDPPQHGKYRNLVRSGFTHRVAKQMEPHIREMVSRIIDRVAQAGACDFVRDIASELPLQVIAELMGVPHEERHLVYAWTNRMVGFDDQSSSIEAKAAAMEMWMYANDLAEKRRQSPCNDLISQLMSSEVDGEHLSIMQFDAFFLLLAVAGNETTRNLTSGGMLALIEHPEQRQRLIENPSLIGTAVEEMLRWVTPLIYFRRTATSDTILSGQRIRKGEKLAIYYPSANRDETVFPDGECFDVGRSPNNHLAFGIGEHHCLGANLARLEIRLLFEELLRRLPDMEIAGPLRRMRSNFVNAINEMPVRYTPERP